MLLTLIRNRAEAASEIYGIPTPCQGSMKMKTHAPKFFASSSSSRFLCLSHLHMIRVESENPLNMLPDDSNLLVRLYAHLSVNFVNKNLFLCGAVPEVQGLTAGLILLKDFLNVGGLIKRSS